MRKFCQPVLCRAAYFRRHEKVRVLSSIRNFKLHENEGRIGETKVKWYKNSIAEQTGNGFGFLFGLHPCRKAQMGKTINLQSPGNRRKLKSYAVQMGFYRGLVTGKKINTVEKVEKAFEAASTVEELKTAFRAMETVFDSDDKRLGMASLKMGHQFESAGEDPQTILVYAEKALRILEKHDKNSVELAMSLHLMGSVHYALTKFDESLGYLNRANKILEKLENEGSPIQYKPIGFAVQLLLGDVKIAMGRREDALSNYTKSLKLKEEVLEPEYPHMAVANRQVAEAFVAVLNFKDALPLCLKALNLHRKQLGENSVEVATDRRLLAAIYVGLGEDRKALEENEAAKKVLKNWGMNKELIYAELDSANVQISVGKYDDAINTLREVIRHTDQESQLRATVLLYTAKALCNLEKYDDSKKCCGLATNLFKKYEQTDPGKVAEAYTELAMMYQTMNDFGVAISLYKKALGIYEKSPQDRHAEASARGRLGYLLLLTGSLNEAISNLESAALILKESFGPHHFGVGYIYNNLGAAYEELERPQTAAQMFLMARDIMEIALGPQHMDTIDTIQNLANVHGSMGSYGLAIGFQQKVIEALKNHGPSAGNELKAAQRCLADLERRAQKPAGKPLKNDIPNHNITGIQSTDKDGSDNEIENAEALKDQSPISMNELKELQGLLAELEELERGAQKPAGKPLKNDIPDHNITGNQSTEKNVRGNEIENTKALKDQGPIPMNELKELQGLLAELEHLERRAQKHAGKPLKDDIPDHSITGNQSTEKKMSENEIEITEALKELRGLVAELRIRTKKPAGKPITNDILDNKITGKQSTGKISGNEIEKTGRISEKILTKKNARKNEIEDPGSISGKLMANLTKKKIRGNGIEDTGVSNTKS